MSGAQSVVEKAKELLAQYSRLIIAGIDDTTEAWRDLGPPVVLRRTFRNGETTLEEMPEFFAKMTLEAIPANEPTVARAMLIYGEEKKHS